MCYARFVASTSACAVHDCPRTVGEKGARGLCPTHYSRFLRHGSPQPDVAVKEKGRRACSIVDCESLAYALGYCNRHYQRLRRNGDPVSTPANPYGGHRTDPLRFVGAETPDGCWVWTGHVGERGYGTIGAEPAHRAVYRRLVGPIPVDVQLDHTCHTLAVGRGECEGGETCPHRRCVNPAHLEPVWHRENVLRGASFAAENARKTHCPRGHPYNVANTYIFNAKGHRRCRACLAFRMRKWRSRREGCGGLGR